MNLKRITEWYTTVFTRKLQEISDASNDVYTIIVSLPYNINFSCEKSKLFFYTNYEASGSAISEIQISREKWFCNDILSLSGDTEKKINSTMSLETFGLNSLGRWSVAIFVNCNHGIIVRIMIGFWCVSINPLEIKRKCNSQIPLESISKNLNALILQEGLISQRANNTSSKNVKDFFLYSSNACKMWSNHEKDFAASIHYISRNFISLKIQCVCFHFAGKNEKIY